jgi:hypothetical protein
MPRRHPRPDDGRRAPRKEDGPREYGDLETHPDGEWRVRRLTGVTVVKAYRCPGCQQLIPVGQPHVVAWPEHGDPEDRRHWHTGCWAARSRRHPPGRARG